MPVSCGPLRAVSRSGFTTWPPRVLATEARRTQRLLVTLVPTARDGLACRRPQRGRWRRAPARGGKSVSGVSVSLLPLRAGALRPRLRRGDRRRLRAHLAVPPRTRVRHRDGDCSVNSVPPWLVAHATDPLVALRLRRTDPSSGPSSAVPRCDEPQLCDPPSRICAARHHIVLDRSLAPLISSSPGRNSAHTHEIAAPFEQAARARRWNRA